jgi:hypothetical protein
MLQDLDFNKNEVDLDYRREQMLKNKERIEREKERELEMLQKEREMEMIQKEIDYEEREKQKIMEERRQRQLAMELEREREREQYSNRDYEPRTKVMSVPIEKEVEYQRPTTYDKHLYKEIANSPSGQIARYEWLENVKIGQTEEFMIRPENTMSDIILCTLMLPNSQIVIGGKDGQLMVYHLSG